jgi:YrbI family 3-deoxy-D-manno-octulosonate 8-phosphate phosphatase
MSGSSRRGQASALGALVVIPARGGSQGVPLKNLADVGGTSLVGRAIVSALAAPGVTRVVVSTDHPGIAAEARRHGADVVERPATLSDATATSESAVLHALDALADDLPVTVLLQCTSPFVDPADLGEAVVRVLAGEADVVLAAAPTHDFQWVVADGLVRPVGHSLDHRPRRQDRLPHFRETGAFYAMRTSGLREAGTRFFGRVALQAVDARTAIEIDEQADLEAARVLAAGGHQGDESEALDVDALVTDFDGVHTDDHAYVDGAGVESVRVHRGDGMGVDLLRRAQVPLLILSTERNPVVRARADKLGVDVLHGIADKAAALDEWISVNRLDPDRVAYVGNDVNDLGAMARIGWPVAVADAHPRVRAAARLVLDRRGGDGAVREVCDRIVAARAPRSSTRRVRPAATTIPGGNTRMTVTDARTDIAPVSIGQHLIGEGQPVYVIAEIGLNHNGDVDIARRLIDVAADAGAQAVKFQKRTPEISTPVDMRDKLRQTPWGEMTYLDYRYRVELSREQYEKVGSHAAERGLQWFASPWDVPSVQFLEDLDVPTHKVASASLTDSELLRELARTGKPIILSTGMSTLEQIDAAVEILGTDGLVILHATSTYPLPPEEANLRTIDTLRQRYGVPVGYSGHERGLQISLAAVALGAVAVERHITLDRTMWGSDQASSLEPAGLEHLVRDIRILQEALGDGEKRVMPGELAPMSRLRRVGA